MRHDARSRSVRGPYLGVGSISGSLSLAGVAEAVVVRKRYAVIKDARPAPVADDDRRRGVFPPGLAGVYTQNISFTAS